MSLETLRSTSMVVDPDEAEAPGPECLAANHIKRHNSAGTFWMALGLPVSVVLRRRRPAIKAVRSKGARDELARHEFRETQELQWPESMLFMFLLLFEKGGDPVAEMGEHRARVTLPLDR
jgi:hypothetical protein